MSNAHLTKTLKDKRLATFGAAWIDPLGSVTFFDDFIGKAFNATDTWTVTNVGTSIPANPAVDSDAGDPNAGVGGWLSMGSDDVDDKSQEIALTTESVKGNFLVSRAGKGMLVFEAVVSLPTALTAQHNCIGFSDDESEAAGTLAMQFGATNLITAQANDAVGFVFDSEATTPAWRGCSVNATAVGTASTATTAVADTATKLRIEVDSAGNAFYFINVPSAATIYPEDPLGASDFVGSQALAVATTLKAIPYVGVGATTTTSAKLETDYVFVAMAR